ncbi:hypothetical protein ISO99_07320 [Staphylococcus sp. 18_1_E_LY]|uniref:Uncharacterized protein n=1 Tax=Staphylococcus lloydii TaxID=2781774 RepID=A0A7T1AZU8_9STAP|nr:hypothetical protein [Staphylococcus lloydii]MBF7019720.1 hypothetical protein [Staphylococcus lloydii]MBF7027448.1 hypothetical protein [Staphylococcus lloydii]QPM75108.1 hypothetical protein ISP08_12455 [Staphylococcus lloydii]
MSLPVAIIVGIIAIPIYAYFWAAIFRWDNNRKAKGNKLKLMRKSTFYSIFIVQAIGAAICVILAIYISYFK